MLRSIRLKLKKILPDFFHTKVIERIPTKGIEANISYDLSNE